MHSDTALYDELSFTLNQINRQIEAIERDVEISIAPHMAPNAAFRQRHRDGKYVLADVLLAKSQCLNGMAIIKASQKKGK